MSSYDFDTFQAQVIKLKNCLAGVRNECVVMALFFSCSALVACVCGTLSTDILSDPHQPAVMWLRFLSSSHTH